MSLTARVNITPELLKKLKAGQTLTFELATPTAGITHIEVGSPTEKGIFDGILDTAFDGVDAAFDKIFGKSPSSRFPK